MQYIDKYATNSNCNDNIWNNPSTVILALEREHHSVCYHRIWMVDKSIHIVSFYRLSTKVFTAPCSEPGNGLDPDHK